MKLAFGTAAAAASLFMNVLAADSFPLWEKGAPGALGNADKDIPTLTVFKPDDGKSTGAAIVICPGGGYGGLAQHEGKDYAEWLAKNGVTGFVLKYRLGPGGYKHPRMLEDAARAVRTVRARASEWSIDPKRIGIMGSSAGGHLASTLLTHFDPGNSSAEDLIDRQSSRPDLGILCYPVITMVGSTTHLGSKKNLLGENPSEELAKLLSNEQQVTKDTPPTFLWHTYEDTGVVPDNSILFALALQKNKVPYELHVYEKGKHGIGLSNGHPWTEQCLRWLKLRGFVKD
jgi:acetyl esterase/lipase